MREGDEGVLDWWGGRGGHFMSLSSEEWFGGCIVWMEVLVRNWVEV